jgi:DNA-directed RNA polymerase specialized sigma24 family protein
MSLNGASGRSDHDLVRAAKDGDQVAFAELMQKHRVRLRKLAYGRLHKNGCLKLNDHLQFVDQNVWAQIWQNLSQIRVDFNGWSAIICLNEASRHANGCRKEKNHLNLSDMEAGGILPQSLMVDYERSYEAHLLLERAFSEAYNISQRFGQVFAMKWSVDEIEFAEIAQALDLSKAAVRATYYRGLGELKHRLGI